MGGGNQVSVNSVCTLFDGKTYLAKRNDIIDIFEIFFEIGEIFLSEGDGGESSFAIKTTFAIEDFSGGDVDVVGSQTFKLIIDVRFESIADGDQKNDRSDADDNSQRG